LFTQFNLLRVENCVNKELLRSVEYTTGVYKMTDANASAPKRKLDRRAVRTRRALRQALIELILEKGYDAITVQDITDRADLNRGTLYLHYRDKQDLLLSSSADVFDELIAQLAPVAPDQLTLDVPERNLSLLYQHVAANADFYRVMLGDHGVPSFIKRLRHVLAQWSLARVEALRALNVPIAALPSEFIANYISGAIIGIIAWWLENNLPLTPEVLARYTLQLSASGLYPSGADGSLSAPSKLSS
jgi:AcrR family transcriptional regulator